MEATLFLFKKITLVTQNMDTGHNRLPEWLEE